MVVPSGRIAPTGAEGPTGKVVVDMGDGVFPVRGRLPRHVYSDTDAMGCP